MQTSDTIALVALLVAVLSVISTIAIYLKSRSDNRKLAKDTIATSKAITSLEALTISASSVMNAISSLMAESPEDSSFNHKCMLAQIQCKDLRMRVRDLFDGRDVPEEISALVNNIWEAGTSEPATSRERGPISHNSTEVKNLVDRVERLVTKARLYSRPRDLH